MLRRMLFTRCRVVAASAAIAVSASGMIHAAEGPRPLPEAAAKVRDVRLAEGGALELQLVDQQGQGISDVPVRLSFGGRPVAESRSDAGGCVRFTSLRPGLHSVQAGNATDSVRLWNDVTAPPHAVNRLAIVASEQVVRGQAGLPGLGLGGASGATFLMGVATVTSLTLAGVSYAETQNQEDEISELQEQLEDLASP